MGNQDIYVNLTEKLNYPPSGYLLRILQEMVTPEEGRLLLELPAQPVELAAKLGMTEGDVEAKLEDFVQRGLAFPGRRRVRFCRDVEELHGFSLSNKDELVPTELLDLWKEFYEAEWCEARGRMYGQLDHHLLKVIPARRALQAESGRLTGQLLPEEDIEAIFRSAELISASLCPCRRVLRRCIAPLDVCVSFNRGAEYVIHKGVGKKLSLEEALAIADSAERAGLVHCLDIQFYLSMCHCCRDCCLILNPGLEYGTLSQALERSRYRAEIGQDQCTGCEVCVDECPFGAIEMVTTSSQEIQAVSQAERCFGCGLCVLSCPSDAIQMIPRVQ